MRIPIVPPLSTKDGTANKNARLTNCLKESKKTGDKAVIRPGLVASDSFTGIGSGLIPFDGRLLVIYGDTVTDPDSTDLPWPLDSPQWDSGTTYGIGETIFYEGILYFSEQSGNQGNTPTGSGYWSKSHNGETYEPGVTYGIGDPVTHNGTPYYSYAPSNTGNTPGDSPLWGTTAPGASRWVGDVFGATGAGDACASAEAAGYSAWLQYPYRSCATQDGATHSWKTYEYVIGGFFYWHQWLDNPPYTCSSTTDAGITTAGTITQTV